jgi:hypothetical protein
MMKIKMLVAALSLVMSLAGVAKAFAEVEMDSNRSICEVEETNRWQPFGPHLVLLNGKPVDRFIQFYDNDSNWKVSHGAASAKCSDLEVRGLCHCSERSKLLPQTMMERGRYEDSTTQSGNPGSTGLPYQIQDEN